MLNLLYNQADHPLELYKRIRKERERMLRLSSGLPTPARSTDTEKNSAARFIEDITCGHKPHHKKDRVFEVRTDEELKMVERFKDYMLVEQFIQDTQ